MSNSILDLVNQRNNGTPQIQQIKNLMQQVRFAQNPQMMLQQLIQQNPNLQNVINVIKMSGTTPQQFAQMLAQQKGVDLNNLIQQLQS